MAENRWELLSDEPPQAGRAVPLRASTNDVLIAYLAGPRYVQRVPRRDQTVRVVCSDGTSFERPITEQERCGERAFVEALLNDFNVPMPPDQDEWVLYLPDAVSEDELRRAIFEAPEEIVYHPGPHPPEALELLQRRVNFALTRVRPAR